MSEEKNITCCEESRELMRGIRGWQIAFIGLGGVIGSCYFLGVGWVIQMMGPATFIAFGVVGLIVFGLMIAYAELLVNVPRKGTFVAYTNEFLGPTISVGMGWSFWANWVIYVPSEAIAVSVALQGITGITGTVPYVAFALGTLAALTIINIAAVDIFAKIESGLAITKVCIIILFTLIGFGIWVGLWGHPEGQLAGLVEDGFKGLGVNFPENVGLYNQLFPNGIAVVAVMMVVVLVTFQGTEIVGLAASESQNPDESVPRACRSVTYRIVFLYMVPVLLVLLIFPFELAGDDMPVFAEIARDYGFGWAHYIFLAVVLVAAFSCGNTGFYGVVRCMYGLAVEGLAPKYFARLNRKGNPRKAVYLTLAGMWVVLLIGLISELTGALTSLYGNLLCLSGFTGTLAWVGIILSQKRMRVRLKQRGYDPDEEGFLKARVKPGLAWAPWYALIAQVSALIMLAFGDIVDPEGNAGGGIVIFIVACSAVILPMIVYWIVKKLGKDRKINTLKEGDIPFDELFPAKPGSEEYIKQHNIEKAD